MNLAINDTDQVGLIVSRRTVVVWIFNEKVVRTQEEEGIPDATLELDQAPDEGKQAVLLKCFTKETVEPKIPRLIDGAWPSWSS